MAIPPVASDGNEGWWPYVMQMGSGIMAGLSGAYFMMIGHGNRIATLEANARNDHDTIKKMEDVIAALADSTRVAHEKSQTQYWELRDRIGQVLTAAQYQKSHEELLAALRAPR